MDNFVSAALVAALSGLAFIAYKHPKGYKRLSGLLSLLYVVVVTVILTWWLAIGSAFSAVKLVVDSQQHKRVGDALGALTPDWWVPWSLVGFMAFVWALELLPYFTGKEDGKDH